MRHLWAQVPSTWLWVCPSERPGLGAQRKVPVSQNALGSENWSDAAELAGTKGLSPSEVHLCGQETPVLLEKPDANQRRSEDTSGRQS